MRHCNSWYLVVAVILQITFNLSAQTASSVQADIPVDQRNPSNMASTYVPLDSWVYPAIDRLAALGYIQTDFTGLRPWTRMECARLVMEADERAASDESNSESAGLYRSLTREFALELRERMERPTKAYRLNRSIAKCWASQAGR